MEKYTATGTTVEEAVSNGLKKLGLKKDEAQITIIFEGKKAF